MHTLRDGTQLMRRVEAHPGIALVVVGNQGCPPCQRLQGAVATVAQRTGIGWGVLHAEMDPGMVAELGITALPTLMVFREGVLLLKRPGLLPERVLEALVEKVRSLDMEQVHRFAA